MYQPQGNTARAQRMGIRSPQWTSERRSPSYRLRQLLSVTIGQPYDRDPCPHAQRTPELILHPEQDPLDHHGHRTAVRWTETRCIRPGAHVRESKLVPAPAPSGDPHEMHTVTVPDDDARLHADEAGRTWK